MNRRRGARFVSADLPSSRTGKAAGPRLKAASAFVVLQFLLACGADQGCGGCAAFTPIPDGGYQGERLDSAGAVRLTQNGFTFVNQEVTPQLLTRFAPGNKLLVPFSCTIQSILGAQLTIADQGAIGCAAESCGLMDGKCDSKDVAKVIDITISSLTLAPRGPDLLDAKLDVTLNTGKIFISSVSRNSALCLFQDPVKCGVDYDTVRTTPGNLPLDIGIKFTVDTRWDRLLSFEVADINGSKVCGTSGANPLPKCLDPNDVAITSEGGCGVCSAANFSAIKTLILGEVTKSLKSTLEDALNEQNCRPCGPMGACPQSGASLSQCVIPDGGSSDAGRCNDVVTGKCVPGLVGVEGRLALDQVVQVVPPNTGIDLSFAAGGGATASATGLTLGLRGGAAPVAIASCVKPLVAPAVTMLPLPDLEAGAPGTADVGLSLSQQFLSRAMFHAQQSGALCLDLALTEMANVDSSLLGTLLPSLNALTDKKPVPLRVVVRPVTPPTATLGEGTFDAMNEIQEPLVRLSWDDMELDLYALLDDRFVRLFTLSLDLNLPLGLSISGCSNLTPVVGDLTLAVTDVKAKNSEILAENLDTLTKLVPSLLAFAEPQLANGLTGFTVPEFNGYRIQLLKTGGVGPVSGTKNFQHLGIWAKLLAQNTPCMVIRQKLFAWRVSRDADAQTVQVALEGVAKFQVSYRVDQGLWSTWRDVPADRQVVVKHPKLLLAGERVIEMRARSSAEPHRVTEPVRVAQ